MFVVWDEVSSLLISIAFNAWIFASSSSSSLARCSFHSVNSSVCHRDAGPSCGLYNVGCFRHRRLDRAGDDGAVVVVVTNPALGTKSIFCSDAFPAAMSPVSTFVPFSLVSLAL